MVSKSHPTAGSSQLLPVSLTSPISRIVDEDDDFQIPPLALTSQRKPLKPLTRENPQRRPYKKPRRPAGKENSDKESACGSHSRSDFYELDHCPFGLDTHSCGSDDLDTQSCGLDDPDTQSCGLECIPSSIDYNVEHTNTGESGFAESNAECEEKEKDAVLTVNKETYKCNSIEGRLLGPRIHVGLSGESNKDDDGFVEEDDGLEVLLKLCSEGDLSEEGMVLCPLCGVDMSGLSGEQRQVHTNECLDKAQNQVQEHISLEESDGPPSMMIESVTDPVQYHQQAVAASPVINWLRNLGLAKYEEAFVRQEIDWEALQWLTEEDLISIGITALGPRKKIMHAVSELRKGHVSLSEAQSKFGSASIRVIERHTKRSPVSVGDKRQPVANKLITEFFPGMVTNTKKVHPTSRHQCMPENSLPDSGGRRAAKSNFRNGKSKAIPTWCCIPGTPFRVDAFKYLRGDCCHWFLTHFHLDHYQGLTKSFCHGKIYCSSVTAKLVNMKIGIPWDRLQVLPLNEKINIAGVDVTCLNANHCPGSFMILFVPPNGKAVLHTGDFRYSEEMASALNRYYINTLILDTTYCHPQYDFPKQEAVIQFVIEAIQAEAFNPKTLFLIGSYTIGKERLFLEVARVLRKKLYISAAKLRLLECLGLSKEDMQWFTANEQESHIHVVPMWTLASFKRLKHIANQYARRFSLVIAFSPTGWTFGKGKKKSPGRRWQQGTIIRYEVPYSEHSSFTELKEFVKLLSPENIIPSVNNDGPDSEASMVSLLLT